MLPIFIFQTYFLHSFISNYDDKSCWYRWRQSSSKSFPQSIYTFLFVKLDCNSAKRWCSTLNLNSANIWERQSRFSNVLRGHKKRPVAWNGLSQEIVEEIFLEILLLCLFTLISPYSSWNFLTKESDNPYKQISCFTLASRVFQFSILISSSIASVMYPEFFWGETDFGRVFFSFITACDETSFTSFFFQKSCLTWSSKKILAYNRTLL